LQFGSALLRNKYERTLLTIAANSENSTKQLCLAVQNKLTKALLTLDASYNKDFPAVAAPVGVSIFHQLPTGATPSSCSPVTLEVVTSTSIVDDDGYARRLQRWTETCTKYEEDSISGFVNARVVIITDPLDDPDKDFPIMSEKKRKRRRQSALVPVSSQFEEDTIEPLLEAFQV
jgi:hypothetical protein